MQAVINFSGGAGGNPRIHAGQPCDPQQLARVFRNLGVKTQVPMLWLYAQNDQYFGAQWPARWHEAFKAGGGQADFRQLAPYAKDGHELFRSGLKAWEPVVSTFLDTNGFAAQIVAKAAAPVTEEGGDVAHAEPTTGAQR